MHPKLLEWGKAIKSDFDTKNVAFKLRHGQPDQVQVAAGFKLLNDLMRDSLAAQGGRLTQQGQQLARQETQIQNLQVTVSNQEKTISEMHAMMTQVHAALIPSGQGGAPAISFRAPLPAAPAPAPGSSTPGSDAASTAAPLLDPASAIGSDPARASALASAPAPAPGAVPSSNPKSSARTRRHRLNAGSVKDGRQRESTWVSNPRLSYRRLRDLPSSEMEEGGRRWHLAGQTS